VENIIVLLPFGSCWVMIEENRPTASVDCRSFSSSALFHSPFCSLLLLFVSLQKHAHAKTCPKAALAVRGRCYCCASAFGLMTASSHGGRSFVDVDVVVVTCKLQVRFVVLPEIHTRTTHSS